VTGETPRFASESQKEALCFWPAKNIRLIIISCSVGRLRATTPGNVGLFWVDHGRHDAGVVWTGVHRRAAHASGSQPCSPSAVKERSSGRDVDECDGACYILCIATNTD
jgi:hypothetical protein